ncbi:hypothetical protein [Mesorhizobium sp. M0239]|uniref:hypothetical protein n=1 Tax=Mesorhizobium sp. M0239 TaxID=2956924 RepID=UPI0033382F8D
MSGLDLTLDPDRQPRRLDESIEKTLCHISDDALTRCQRFVPLFLRRSSLFCLPHCLKELPILYTVTARHFAETKLAHEIEAPRVTLAAFAIITVETIGRENKLRNIGKAARRPAIPQAALHLILCLVETAEF